MAYMVSIICKRFSNESLLAFFLAITVIATAVLQPSDSLGKDNNGYISVRFEKRIRFMPMMPGEIFNNNHHASTYLADEGSFSPDVTWDGTIVEPALTTSNIKRVYDTKKFSRWTHWQDSNRSCLWKITIYDDDDDDDDSDTKWNRVPSIDVAIDVEDDYGRSGRLSHVSDRRSWIKVKVLETRTIPWDDDDDYDDDDEDTTRFCGWAHFSFNISKARRSGEYTGTVHTTLTFL
ncbi:hypothetical protein CR164_01335 [Prosthecochloris marina]|uniref:Uncharacterized protein n=1 Tax=Prosthecochloris marina TaxID=2017681 RepID=A0A317TBL4_9CHLB|nr:hypothetical protein [Prosthecochloris marina]PWW83231.1 hypothetical protein CR164_01335 [Prosthecochloris marina]